MVYNQRTRVASQTIAKVREVFDFFVENKRVQYCLIEIYRGPNRNVRSFNLRMLLTPHYAINIKMSI